MPRVSVESEVRITRGPGSFEAPVLGLCNYRSVFILNDIYGGYSAECEGGSIFADYVGVDEVLGLAKSLGLEVILSGGAWREVGREGYGEKVSPDEAYKLVLELRRRRP
jgi:hypothetical protein